MSQQAVVQVVLTIKADLLTVSSPPPPDGRIGSPYSHQFAVTGGTAPYTWTVTSGTPPAGLTLDSGGVLSGTPTAKETASFEVTVTDSEP